MGPGVGGGCVRVAVTQPTHPPTLSPPPLAHPPQPLSRACCAPRWPCPAAAAPTLRVPARPVAAAARWRGCGVRGTTGTRPPLAPRWACAAWMPSTWLSWTGWVGGGGAVGGIRGYLGILNPTPAPSHGPRCFARNASHAPQVLEARSELDSLDALAACPLLQLHPARFQPFLQVRGRGAECLCGHRLGGWGLLHSLSRGDANPKVHASTCPPAAGRAPAAERGHQRAAAARAPAAAAVPWRAAAAAVGVGQLPAA